MISTSFISGTGLKKCMPMTWPGLLVAAAILVSEIDEVLEVRIASCLQILSRSANSFCFSSTFSSAASTIRSLSANESMVVVVVIRESAASRSAAPIFSRLTSRSRLLRIVSRPRLANSSFTSLMTTS